MLVDSVCLYVPCLRFLTYPYPPFPHCLIAECVPCHHRNLQQASPHLHSTPWLQMRNLGLPMFLENLRLNQELELRLATCPKGETSITWRKIQLHLKHLPDHFVAFCTAIHCNSAARPSRILKELDKEPNHWLKQTDTSIDQIDQILYQPLSYSKLQAMSANSRSPKCLLGQGRGSHHRYATAGSATPTFTNPDFSDHLFMFS